MAINSNVFNSLFSSNLTDAQIIAALGYTPASAGAVVMADGSAASPGMFFGSDTNTGFYKVAADNLGISAGGTAIASLSSARSWFTKYFVVDATVDGFTPLVDMTLGDVNGDGYTELRLQDTPLVPNNFFALYYHNQLGFIEMWKSTGEATIDISPKSKDLTSAEVFQLFRNGESAGARKFRIFDGGSGISTAQTELRGIGDGYINLNGGMLGVANSVPLATLHAVGTRGATANEVARFSATSAAGAGLSLGYNNTTPSAYIQNLHASGNPDIKLGFGATLGSNVAVTFSRTGLLSTFGGNITVPAASSVGIGLTAPLATLHVEGQSGSTTNELARFTKSVGGTALGLSLLYSDAGSTIAGLFNRYSGGGGAAIQIGFGTALSTLVALTCTRDLVTTFGGLALTLASATAGAGLRLPHGAAPTSPVDGDMWTTSAGAFIRINGVTKTFTLT